MLLSVTIPTEGRSQSLIPFPGVAPRVYGLAVPRSAIFWGSAVRSKSGGGRVRASHGKGKALGQALALPGGGGHRKRSVGGGARRNEALQHRTNGIC
jgi:hypothetical protein